MALSLINADTFNACTGAFQVLAFAGMWHWFKAVSVTVRLVPYVCVMAPDAAIACLGYTSFVTNLTSFLDVLLVIFIPWYAVNLAAYFVVRCGAYDAASFSAADDAYRRFAWRGCWRIRPAWLRNGPSSPSLTTTARWSRRSAGRTSPGLPGGSPPSSSPAPGYGDSWNRSP